MPTWARIGKRTSETLSVALRYLFGLFARFAEWLEVTMRFDYPSTDFQTMPSLQIGSP